MPTNLETLKVKLDIKDNERDKLLQTLLDDARDEVLDRIGREVVPPRLQSVVVEIAVIAYNRLGTEGEQSRSEGGWSSGYLDELPSPLLHRLNNYPRRIKVVR